MSRKSHVRAQSRQRLLLKEIQSDYAFRELNAKKLKFGFTSKMLNPSEIITVGRALEIIRNLDPLMKESVVQYKRTVYEKNRIFVYTNSETIAKYIRELKKIPTTTWRAWPRDLENT